MKQIAGYTVVSRLGSGAKSTIYAVKDEHGSLFALKHVVRQSANDDRFIEQAVTEHEVASQFDHPNLRKSFKLIRQRALIRVREIHVLLELLEGQALSELQDLSVPRLCELFLETARGLDVMHQAGYVHADIKPNNIIVSDQAVKIIDFGQSCRTGMIKPRVQGTPDYIAPEQVMKMQITPRTDIFNLGASLYYSLTGRAIPTMVQRSAVGSLAMQSRYIPPNEINENTPPAMTSLIRSCIEAKPASRPANMQAVITRLEIAHRQSLEHQST